MERVMVKLDYACHELEAKKHLKEIVELLNKNKFGEAAGKIEFVIVELRMMKAAINSHIG
jgi:hypothetical protein